MKLTTKFLYIDVFLVAVALATATICFLSEVRDGAEDWVLREQEQHLKTFYKLADARGKGFRVVNGQLLAGDLVLNGRNELPDSVTEIFGGNATIFLGDRRIATNVLDSEGHRALGTRLTGAARDAIFKEGRGYRGEALVLGVPSLTAYDPIRNAAGETIGALYVGTPKSAYLALYDSFRSKVILFATLIALLFSSVTFLLMRLRRRDESTLAENELKFRRLFELQGDAIVTADSESGVIVEANQSACLLYAVAREELVGSNFRDLSADGTADPAEGISVCRHRRRDGHLFPVEMRTSRFLWNGREVTIAAIRDVTQRERAQQAMTHLNRTLRTLTKCSEALVRAQNEPQLLTDLCRLIVEEGGYRLAWVAYAEEDPLLPLRPVAHAGHQSQYLESLRIVWGDEEAGRGPVGTAIRTGAPSYLRDTRGASAFTPWREKALAHGFLSILAVPLPASTQLGSLNIYSSEPDAFDEEEVELMVQLASDLAYGIGALRTRASHQLASEALKATAEEYRTLAASRDRERTLLRALLDSIPDLIFFKDQSSVYLGCNKAFELFAGRSEKELAGLSDFDLFPEEVAVLFREMDRQMMAQRQARRNEEWVDYPDGRHLLLETLKTPFYDQQGSVRGLIGISRDITERHLAEAQRVNLETQLHQAQKMEAVGQLAGGIAHDFNNILTAIMGYSDILASRLEQGSTLAGYAQQVQIATGRAAELTARLLAFSRKQVLRTKPVDLRQVVRDFEKMLARIIPEDIDFTVRLPDEDLIVTADRGQLEQVLMNLVTNAKDAMPQGGKLRIEGERGTMDQRYLQEHGFGRVGAYACLRVSDSGIGMEEETRNRIFEPFFTTKELGKGTGLGMAISYGIVKQHNGFIEVESEPGRGTTFRIYLPLLAEREKEVEGAAQEPAPRGGREGILLAEDDAAVRELHKMVLEQAGYRVVEAVDGRDALEKFLARRDELHLLATDVVMPKLDGKGLYEEIRKVRPEMAALFMSGYTKDIVIQRGVVEGDFALLNKPFQPGELLKKVRSILDQQEAGGG